MQIPAPDFLLSFSVLIVDDTLVVRKSLENRCLAVLEGRGLLYSVQTAKNGLEGLAFCEKNKYDYYIIDKDMPEMSGVEVCRTILRKEPTAKVVLYTAAAKDELAKENIPEGVEIIPKNPVMLATSLVEQIETVKTRTMAGRKNSSQGTND